MAAHRRGRNGILGGSLAALAASLVAVAAPASAQILRPPGFLDIAGTYANRGFDAYCKPIHPPNDILRLVRVGEIEETETGAILHYEGVLENYRTYWVRDDCPSVDQNMPSCIGLSSPAESHCELAGQSFAVSGTVTYNVSDSVFGRFIDGVIDLEGVSDGSQEPPLPGGTDPYIEVTSTDIAVQLGGERLPLGEVNELPGYLDYTGTEYGPLELCLCYAHKVEGQVFCCTGKPTFEKLGGPTAQLEIAGEIEGVLRSSQPTVTETPNEVQFANLQLLLQEDGQIRARQAGESAEDYEAYLDARRLRAVKSLAIERRSDGTYTFAAPGRFVFADVPVFHVASRGGKEVLVPAFYAVRIVDAHTDEQALDGGGDPIEGKVAPVPFTVTTAHNFVPKSVSREVLLDPADEIEAKQSIVDRLRTRCPLNYTDAENEAATYLEQLRLGQIELTEEVEEGLSRGVWAERAVNAGVPLADELIGIQLRGLAKLISDAIGELVKFESQKLKDAKKTVEKMKNTPPTSVPAGFNASGVTAAQQQALAEARDVVETAAVTAAIRKTVKVLKVPMRAALVEGGVEPATATRIVDLYVLAIDSIMNEAEKGRLEAGLVPVLRFLIERIVPELKPLLLDSVGLGGGSSYCAITTPPLVHAVDAMQAWGAANQNVYLADRQKVVRSITAMNDEASLVIAATSALLEIASGLSAVQDAADVIANAVKWVEVVKKAALVSKFGANAIAAVAPPVETFARLPGFVEEGVYHAFGETPPSLRVEAPAVARRADEGTPTAAAAGPGSRASLGAGVPDDFAYKNALDAIGDALRVHDFGLTVQRFTDDSAAGYAAVRAAWAARADALTLVAAGADAAGLDAAEAESVTLAHAEIVDLLAIEAEMIEELRAIAVDVLTAQYDAPTDALYVARRKRVLALIDATIVKVGAVTIALQSMSSKLDFAGVAFAPAVVIESLEATSDASGETFVGASPETFTVRAHLRNAGGQAVGAFAAVLSNPSENAGVSIDTAAEQPVGGLAAADATNGAGADEVDVEWTVTFAGELNLDPVFLDVRVVEGGEEPASFVSSARQTTLVVDPDLADADLDGLPDDWETDKGLDPEADDADEDPDGDGLVNRAELALGTHPMQADTDGDGRDDGEEYLATDGFSTDPLDDDTDDDGALDGADGDPLDGDSQDPPPPADEPAVAVSSQAVALTADAPVATIDVSNAGTGVLVWTAAADEPALVSITPASPATQSGPAKLYVTTGAGFDVNAEGALQTKVRVADVGGAIRDAIEITVTVGEGEFLCGHPVSSAANPITASDALFTLRAAVGIGSCASCLCDADGSGAVTAVDALVVLRAAVGQPVTLSCPLC